MITGSREEYMEKQQPKQLDKETMQDLEYMMGISEEPKEEVISKSKQPPCRCNQVKETPRSFKTDKSIESSKDVEFDDNKKNWVENTIDEEINDKIYLTPEELANLNFYAEQYKTFKKEREVLDLKLQLLNIQKQLLESKIEIINRDKIILDFYMLQQKQKQDEFAQKNKEYLKNISKKHPAIKDTKWGYNPESGEIIIN